MVRSLAQWLWLLDIGVAARALDASDDTSGELSAALGQHFNEVHTVREDVPRLDELRAANARQGWAPATLSQGSLQSVTWNPATFDCIVLNDVLARRRLANPDILDDLGACWRLLRANGWLIVASPTPPVLRRRNAGLPSLSKRRLSGLLSRAGFHDVRCLWVEHSLDRPLFLIPDERTTIAAYESYDAMRGSATRQRRAAAKSGLSSLLYPAYVLLARA